MLRSALFSRISPMRTSSLLLPKRTFCLGAPTQALARAHPQILFFTSSPLHARFPSHALGVKAALPAGTLQRWLSTTSRAPLRYHPPPRRERPRQQFLGFLDSIPHNTVFYGIIGLNAIVFGMWYMAKQQYASTSTPLPAPYSYLPPRQQQERDPAALVWMARNFTTSWDNIISGRFWTPLTACFSHQGVAHILFNGFTFYFMAQPVLSILGSRQFLFLYLGGGLFSSFSSGIWAKVTGKNNYSSQGASGAIFSVTTLLACVAPTMKFHLYGILPVPAWLAISGLFAYDLYSTLADKGGMTDTMGHVGGIVAGILYFASKRFRMF